MDHQAQAESDEVVDLGAASVVTEGVGKAGFDTIGRQPLMGMSDD